MRPSAPLSLFVLSLLLAGCAADGGRFDTPQVPLPDRYRYAAIEPAEIAGTGSSSVPVEPALDRRLATWWRLLGSRELDGLIDRALANSQELRIAAQQVLQAKARAEQARAGRLPTVTVPVEHKVEAPRNGIGTVSKGGKVSSEQTDQISLRGDLRVDLWGERRALHESAELALWRAIFEHDDRRRKLIAEVVDVYVEYLSLNDRMRVARETERVLRDMLEAMRARLEKGDATITDLEQQRAAVHSVRATLPTLALRREQLANRLALLTGGVSRGLILSEDGLDALRYPRVVPGVPSSLLLRRPDVRAVEARLLAADADIEVARARLLPPLDLTARVGYGSNYLSQLFQPHTLFWDFVANLSVTLFDGGDRDREEDYARAVHEEMVETYVRVIYTAMLEVEDALASIDQNGRRLEIQSEATEAAESAWRHSREAYTLGAIDYLTLLDTVRTYHRNLDDLHRFRMENYQGLVALFSALGGGTPERVSLPGEGERPAGNAGAGGGAAADVPAGPGPADDGWQPYEWSREGAGWLVELSGVHLRDGVEASWRDLQGRYPAMVGGHALLARLAQATVAPEGAAASWYRLFVDGFPDEAAADRWCETLRAEQQRCRVVTSEERQTFAGRFPWSIAETPTAAADDSSMPAAAPAAEAPAASDGFAVQLGTYSSAERAHAALAPWREKGYRPFVIPVEAGEGRAWHTVRVAPGPSREAVERDAAALARAEGVEAVVVPQRLDGAGRPERVEGFAVQLGYYTHLDAAAATAALWHAKGYDPYVVRVVGEGAARRYSVRLAPCLERAAALAEREAFSVREGVDAFVVPQHLDADGRPSVTIGYALQLGSYQARGGAERTAARWRERGFPAYVCVVDGGDGEPWYTVRLGASPQRDGVDSQVEALRGQGADAVVVPAELDGGGQPRALPPSTDGGAP
ncbi:efflux transporter outer membrane subunit [Endothiovibrio diazotrophicus]